MSDETGQPEPARPVAAGPAWQRTASQRTDADWRSLLTAKEKARAATPGLQKALTGVAVVAILIALVAGGVFSLSDFRAMDMKHGVDAEGNPTFGDTDYTAYGLVFLAVCGALIVVAGVWLDLAARTRAILMSTGAAVLVLLGGGVVVLLNPSNADLRAYYHVGEWGSAASFDRLVYTLDALALLMLACGLAVAALMVVQRRTIAAVYPE